MKEWFYFFVKSIELSKLHIIKKPHKSFEPIHSLKPLHLLLVIGLTFLTAHDLILSYDHASSTFHMFYMVGQEGTTCIGSCDRLLRLICGGYGFGRVNHYASFPGIQVSGFGLYQKGLIPQSRSSSVISGLGETAPVTKLTVKPAHTPVNLAACWSLIFIHGSVFEALGGPNISSQCIILWELAVETCAKRTGNDPTCLRCCWHMPDSTEHCLWTFPQAHIMRQADHVQSWFEGHHLGSRLLNTPRLHLSPNVKVGGCQLRTPFWAFSLELIWGL